MANPLKADERTAGKANVRREANAITISIESITLFARDSTL
jgi:hypothetical protein